MNSANVKNVVLGCVLFSGLLVSAAPKPSAEVLGRWVGGKWPLEGRVLANEFSKAATLTGVSVCDWSPDHVFVLCDQSVAVNGKEERSLSVFSFDAQSGSYHYVEVTPSGERPEVNELVISQDGNRWEYRGAGEVKGKKVIYRTINEYHGPDRIEWWSEHSTDEGKNWTRSAEGTERRVR